MNAEPPGRSEHDSPRDAASRQGRDEYPLVSHESVDFRERSAWLPAALAVAMLAIALGLGVWLVDSVADKTGDLIAQVQVPLAVDVRERPPSGPTEAAIRLPDCAGRVRFVEVRPAEGGSALFRAGIQGAESDRGGALRGGIVLDTVSLNAPPDGLEVQTPLEERLPDAVRVIVVTTRGRADEVVPLGTDPAWYVPSPTSPETVVPGSFADTECRPIDG